MITQWDWDETFHQSKDGYRRICKLDAEETCQELHEDWNQQGIKFCCVRASYRDLVRVHLFIGQSNPHESPDEDLWDCWAPCEQHLQMLTEKFDFGLRLAYYQLTVLL